MEEPGRLDHQCKELGAEESGMTCDLPLAPVECGTDAGPLKPLPWWRPIYQKRGKVLRPSFANINPLKMWAGLKGHRGYRQEYLLEMMRRKGRCDYVLERCTMCGRGEPEFHCQECSYAHLECAACCVRCHTAMPLHVVWQWDGTHFEKCSLRSIGLHIQLGHEDGSYCLLSKPAHHNFTVLHTNGLHKVAIDFCNCMEQVEPRQQMMCFGWFPSMVVQPRTGATFECLDTFMACTLTSKMSTYDYYKSLAYQMDACGLDLPKNHYKPFLWMVREYRHLLLLMHGGKGNEQDGATNVGSRELAMDCPACLQPGVNLPPDWQEKPAVTKFKYTKLVVTDTNFHMCMQLRSDDIMDPGLHTGLAYYVEESAYKAHISKYASQKDISTCSGFKTLLHAEMKASSGLHATGVVMCLCARHKMVGGLSVGDLQKGERYCNLDYITLSALKTFNSNKVFFSYDIACQWFPGFVER
ncbi:uncharacterized protein ARMOST_21892 [Armillaria ostoyae]|uniref:CxC2-like cysteine cluster KDZ transposase-associated domain-containing protein n=1 Tax=Armillaria ostoyae TaxID=47428 RepID=A0A284SBF8_ARMOS|nr:uncharacterized protein ARMOST_21892 [Armillaria ostoyae]